MFKKIIYCACLCFFASRLAIAQQSSPGDLKIDGRLVDAVTNQPIAHARVAIAPVTQRDAFTTIVTAEDGLFAFSGLKAGKYALSAQAHGYVFQSFNQHDQYASSIVVGEGAISSGLIFRLSKENIIEGAITDEAGEPVRNAQITLYQTGTAGGSQGTRVRNHDTTNDEGNYHFGHLPTGDYIVSAVAEVWYARRNFSRKNLIAGIIAAQGGTFKFSTNIRVGGDVTADSVSSEPESFGPLDVAYPLTYFPGVTEPGSASVIHLTRGERYVADFNLQPVRALHLKIPSPGGPQSSTSFNLSQKMVDGSVVPVPTQSMRLPSGEFEIEGIPPGHYTLTANTYTPAEAGAKPGLVASTSTREIDALGNGVVEEGKTAANSQVKAKFMFDPGDSVPGRSFVQLYDFKTRQSIFEQVPESGEVEFKQNVPPGTYEISMNSNGNFFIRSITATGARAYGRTVVIKGAAPVNLDIAVGKGQGHVIGVALRDGQPLAGVMIVAVPRDPAHNRVLFRRDQSDSDGTFSLPNVVPGDYTLLAIDNGWDLQWLKPEVLKPYLAQGEPIQVKQSGKYEVKLKVQ